MDKTETEQLKKLLQIIQPIPMQRIGHFSDRDKGLVDILSRFSQENEYEYILNCTGEEFYQFISQKYKLNSYTKVKRFDLDRTNYLLQGKFYEYLFVTCDIKDNMKASFLQKCHKAIKNAGLIVIFVLKDNHEQTAVWTQLLEENYFVATSSIQLSKSYDVVISRKMHGWGG